MVNYICPKCNKNFNKKCHYVEHTENKKKPCDKSDLLIQPNPLVEQENTLVEQANPLVEQANLAFEQPNTLVEQSNPVVEQPNSTNRTPNLTIGVPNYATSPSISPSNSTDFTSNVPNFIDILIKEPVPNNNNNNCVCIYCKKIFARPDSLQRHLNNRCKPKENYNELEKLKEDIKMIIQNYQKIENNYQNLENENINLKKEIKEIKTIHNGDNKNTETNEQTLSLCDTNFVGKKGFESQIINNNNQINKGVILNTTNIQIVQFGEEDINKINLHDAMKMYLKSTGGNIASNMLAYLNMNKEYPENNNICITDNSREIVKMHNGKKFVYKKFKNVKNDILDKVLKNTRKIVTKFEDDKNIKRSLDTQTKLKINDVSLKLIDGVDGEEIVREEIKEKERELKLKNDVSNGGNEIANTKHKKNNPDDKNDKTNSDSDNGTESEEERDFTFEERLRVEHLNKKREGLQIKTFENLKEELYNGRELLTK
jgi:hypothetical protein